MVVLILRISRHNDKPNNLSFCHMLPGTRVVELRRTNGLYNRLMEESVIKIKITTYYVQYTFKNKIIVNYKNDFYTDKIKFKKKNKGRKIINIGNNPK